MHDLLLVHGFETVDGQKLSKTVGNLLDPFACVRRYGADAVRYHLLRAVPPFEDGDFSLKRLQQLYETDLANGLGNLVSRVTHLCDKAG